MEMQFHARALQTYTKAYQHLKMIPGDDKVTGISDQKDGRCHSVSGIEVKRQGYWSTGLKTIYLWSALKLMSVLKTI